MAQAALDPLQLIHAEALSFALTTQMPRPEVQAATKALCQEARATRTALADLVMRAYPSLDVSGLFDTGQQMGHAPDAARAFVQRLKNL